MSAADRTFHLVANIKRAYQQAEKVTQLDEPLAGENLREKGYEFLHFQIIAIDAQRYVKNPYLCKNY